MDLLSTAQLDTKVAVLQKKKSDLQAELKEAEARSAKMLRDKDALRFQALRNGDAKAKSEMNKLRQSMAATAMEVADIADEISAIDAELAQLQQDRIAAVRAEAWNEFVTVAETAVKKSTELESTVEKFFEMLKPHCATLQKVNALLARADVHDKGFSLELFRSRLDEKFRTGFGEFFGKQGRIFHRGSIYESDYKSIVEARIKGIKQRHAGVAVDEPIEEAVNE